MNYLRKRLDTICERMEFFHSLLNDESLSKRERRNVAGNYNFYKLKFYECEIPPIPGKVKGEDDETSA